MDKITLKVKIETALADLNDLKICDWDNISSDGRASLVDAIETLEKTKKQI